MAEIFLKIAPVIFIIFLGYLLKVLKVFKSADGDVIIKIVFYFSLPALVLTSIPKLEFSLDTILLPLICVSIIFISFGILLIIKKWMKLPPLSWAVFLIGILILNNGFLIPFVHTTYGDVGVANLLIFDFMNGFLAFTFVYFHAVKYSPQKRNKKMMLNRFLSSPPIYAIVLALIINYFDLKIPPVANELLDTLGKITIPLILLSLGIFFSPKISGNFKPVFLAILLRSGIGVLLGILFVRLFGITGLEHDIVILSAAAPIGFNTITFASMENLDKNLAASMVSYSFLAGIIYIPIIIFVLS